jgi:hypothetical protein
VRQAYKTPSLRGDQPLETLSKQRQADWLAVVVWLSMSRQPWMVRHTESSVFEQLAVGLAGSELQSVLLYVMQSRATRRKPSELLAQYERDAFCAPSQVDLRTSIEIDTHLLAAAQGFDAIELSPVAPLGTCSVVAPTDQKRVLSALRMTEVVSDPSNVLALECAQRMRARPGSEIHLVTTQRVIRAQPVPKLPGYAQHFRIFVLASAAPEARDHAFTVQAVVRHVGTMLGALDRLERHGYCFGVRRVDVLATPQREHIGDRVAERLGAIAERRLLEHPYYSGGLRYQIWVTAADGASVPLIDGGVFDWLATIGSNRRAVYVASGAGAQLIPQFRSTASGW